jgi:DNA-binding IclR family transcriptional regulator
MTEADGPLHRAMSLLRVLASHSRKGVALSQLTSSSGLPHPTVHRLLNQLIEERLVYRDPDTRRYSLGALAFELGVAAAQQFDIRVMCRPVLTRLAMETGDTAYLVVRSGDEAVCIDRQEGHAPIRVMTLEVGSRRLLGVGAGGLAILSAMQKTECAAYVDSYHERLEAENKLPKALLMKSIADAQSNGFALIKNRITLGTTAIGCHIRDSLGNPIAAVSIAAINERLDAQNTRLAAGEVVAAAHTIEETLRGFGGRRL